MNTKRNVLLWILYDFANSFVQIVFFLYFAQWVVIDRGVADVYFNLAFAVSAIFLLLSAPFVGLALDSNLRRITGLRFTTLLVVVFYALCAFSAITGLEIVALIFFTMGLYAYLLSFTFYTPLLNAIASSEKRGFVSGLGILGHYTGQCLGLILALPFALGTVSLFGGDSRTETLLPAIMAFLVFSLPMLCLFKESIPTTPLPKTGAKLKLLINETKELRLVPGLVFFLLAYFFMTDAILTASNNFPIFLEQVWQISDQTKTYILLGIILTSGIGGLMSGFVSDLIGHKKTMMGVVIGWIVIFPLLALVKDFTLFIILTTGLGFWFGAHFTVSRSLMATLAPVHNYHLAFSYFSLVERAASFAGPLLWGFTVTMMVDSGPGRYQVAMFAMTFFVVMAFMCLLRVKNTVPLIINR